MNHDPYFLGKLPDDECWSILRKMVLAGEEVPKELEDLKKQILRKCDGLPLAAKLIGGLLLTNGREKWRSILEDSLLNEDQSEINQILAVSFDHLSPPSVKKCFAYCAIFPQDTELEEDELIQHWIAKGFLLPDQKNKGMMEETGSVYCRILLQNSLLEKVEDKWRRTYYKMHDLVHDFANSILNPASSNQDRYLALSSSKGLAENTKMIIPASIHTLFLHLGWCKSADMLSRFKHLHVLRLSGYVFFLPSSIDQLQHLRLLDILSSRIKSLPESLCKLYNLQTLTLKDGAFERGFPKRMSNLISLRHLNYHHYPDNALVDMLPVVEFKMPTQMGRLTCLQTLRFFNVSQEKGCGVEELGTLKYLKGSLEIRNLELVKGKEAADQAKLFEKPNLSRLEFRWEKSKDRKSDNYDEDVLEGLQPHQNLQELEIYYFLGNKFPQWFMNLSELVELRIEYCERCSELPTLGQLPSLKRLYLNGLDNIQFIGDEFYSITNEEEEEEGRQRGLGSSTRSRKFFPVLEELHVQYMENLVEWKDVDRLTINEAELDVFPMIREFAISDCPRLTTLPCLSKIMEVRYCPNLASVRTGNGTSIERLILADCNNLREFPEDTFRSSLRELDIRCCTGLISLGVNGQKCPLPCLEKFTIEDCDELISLPSSSKILVVKNCPKLTSIRTGNGTSLEDLTLTGCDNLRELPEGLFGSSLRNVQIKYCPRLISLGVNGQKCPLPWLEKFIIEDCDELITLPCLSKILVVKNCPKLTSIRTGNGTSLEDLTLTGCDNLRELPEGLLGSSLWNVQIKYCPRLIRLGVNGQKCPLPCLEKFTIEDCNESTTIPDKMFGSCTSIALLGCPNLEPFSLNLQETPSLRTFNLVDCPKLMPQRFKGFAYATCLIELRIGPFSLDDSSIDDFDWSGLISAPALRVLALEGLPHTDSLPCQLQYLTSLTSLALDSFGGIEVLADWIGDLVSLKYLELWDCKKLRSLPSETAMRRLTKFTHLQVYGCPLLRQRYTPNKGIYHLEEEISRDPASSESEEEEIDDNEQAGRDG